MCGCMDADVCICECVYVCGARDAVPTHISCLRSIKNLGKAIQQSYPPGGQCTLDAKGMPPPALKAAAG